MRSKTFYYAVVAGLLMVAAPTHAQMMSGSTGTKVMVGPFVGMNYTTVGGSDATNAGYKAGVAAGLQLDADFDGGIFFRTGALYSMRGATATQSGVDITLKENFIEVPLLLGYSFASAGSMVKPFILAGGQADFKTSCDIEGTVSGTKTSVKCADASNFSSTDFSVAGGGGVMFPAASGTVSIDGRYAYGLQKIAKDSNVKHRGFTVGIAYMIPFGH